MIDTDKRYRHFAFPGVALYAVGHPKEHSEGKWVFQGDENDDEDDESLWALDGACDIEWYGGGECSCPVDEDHTIVVMVGDDQEHIVATVNLDPLDDDDYCSGCGQIGCTADGR